MDAVLDVFLIPGSYSSGLNMPDWDAPAKFAPSPPKRATLCGSGTMTPVPKRQSTLGNQIVHGLRDANRPRVHSTVE